MNLFAPYRLIALLALAPATALADAGAHAAADAGSSGPQSFTAEAPPTARFGEPFPYTVRVTHPKGEVYALPKDPELGEFDLVSAEKQELPNGPLSTTVFNLQLRPWAVGSKAIPELGLEVTGSPAGSKLAIPGPTVEIVGTMDPDAGEGEPLRDIAPPVDVPVRTWRVPIAVGVALAVAALAYALLRFLKRPKPEVVVPAAPPEPAHVRAKRSLEGLLAEDLAAQGRQRELYFRLSEITRRYLGECFGFAAIDLTTEELLGVLRRRHTPGLDLGKFAQECQDADLVKFAKLRPDGNACKGSIDAALNMVMATHLASLPQPGGRSA